MYLGVPFYRLQAFNKWLCDISQYYRLLANSARQYMYLPVFPAPIITVQLRIEKNLMKLSQTFKDLWHKLKSVQYEIFCNLINLLVSKLTWAVTSLQGCLSLVWGREIYNTPWWTDIHISMYCDMWKGLLGLESANSVKTQLKFWNIYVITCTALQGEQQKGMLQCMQRLKGSLRFVLGGGGEEWVKMITPHSQLQQG